jgi:hypothetical protein
VEIEGSEAAHKSIALGQVAIVCRMGGAGRLGGPAPTDRHRQQQNKQSNGTHFHLALIVNVGLKVAPRFARANSEITTL